MDREARWAIQSTGLQRVGHNWASKHTRMQALSPPEGECAKNVPGVSKVPLNGPRLTYSWSRARGPTAWPSGFCKTRVETVGKEDASIDNTHRPSCTDHISTEPPPVEQECGPAWETPGEAEGREPGPVLVSPLTSYFSIWHKILGWGGAAGAGNSSCADLELFLPLQVTFAESQQSPGWRYKDLSPGQGSLYSDTGPLKLVDSGHGRTLPWGWEQFTCSPAALPNPPLLVPSPKLINLKEDTLGNVQGKEESRHPSLMMKALSIWSN